MKTFLQRLIIANLLLVLSCSYNQEVMAHGVSVDVSRIEETDDIFKNAIGISYQYGNVAALSWHYWRRHFGPAKENRQLISIYGLMEPAKSFDIQVKIGPSLLLQNSTYQNKSHSTPLTTSEYNIGLLLGARMGLIHYRDFTLSARVDSHLFPADTAVIVGVTGRKLLLSLSLSYAIDREKTAPQLPTLTDFVSDYFRSDSKKVPTDAL